MLTICIKLSQNLSEGERELLGPAPSPSLWLLMGLYYNSFLFFLFLWLVRLALISNSIYIYLRCSTMVLERLAKLYQSMSIL